MTPPLLDYDLHVPQDAGDGARVAVLLHGRGSHKGDLQGLRRGLPGRTVLVTPQAPHPGRTWGYGPGWAWYRYVADDRIRPETLDDSLSALGAFLDALEDALPVRPGPLVVGGFSQGGTTALAWALRNPARVAGVAVFSGFLAESEADALPRRDAGGLRVFWGHGRQDPAIPHALAVRGRARLEEAGARVEAGDYPVGHGIAPEELADAARWMEEVAPV